MALTIPNDALSLETRLLALLIGLLKPDGDDKLQLEQEWFADPVASLRTAPQRLQNVADLIATVLTPAASTPPPVFAGARWYVLPDSAFALVAPDSGPGQIGLGALHATSAGNVAIDLFAYVPVLSYSDSGAHTIVGSSSAPLQIGLTASSADGKGFIVGNDTFGSMTVAADLYLDPAAYETAPAQGYFTLSFADLQGGLIAAHHTLGDLLDPTVESWVGQVLVQSGTWLATNIGNAPVSLGAILAAGGFLTNSTSGYQFDVSSLRGRSARDIATEFLYGALQALSDNDVPVAAFELPGGGVYFTRVQNGDGTADYGLHLALDMELGGGQQTAGKPGTEIALTLGRWLTGEDDDTSWISRSLGRPDTELPAPGVSLYLLREGVNPAEITFAPSFAITSVGLNISGKPLVSVDGVTIDGVDLRAYLDERAGWRLGAAARLDSIGLPLGPKLESAGQGGNPVASSILSTGSPQGGGDPHPVNPTVSLSAAWVQDGNFALQLLDAENQPAKTLVLPVQRSLGPLALQRLGVGWIDSEDELSLLVDGSIQVQQLTIGLQGLSVGIPATDPGDFSRYPLDLDGLGIEFSAGEVSLSAAFVKRGADPNANPPRDYIEYDGEALVQAGHYAISALGSYAQVTDAAGSSYTSLFVFGVLDAILGGPPFFYVTGLAAGFGYNRGLLLPAQDQVTTFPLVQAASDPTKMGAVKRADGSWQPPDPTAALADLDTSVPPQHGEYWFAAGARFTTFDLMQSTALLVVEFGNELEIAVLGISQITLPPAAPGEPPPSQRYLYAELGVEVKVLPNQGVFTATAILTTNSFLLDPACKLTGGFALYFWFGDNPHAGEFVLTLGGYHPAFSPPSYYPSVPRLGFNWPMGGGVTVSGDAYFALTPSAVMAGGSLQVLYASGDLKAWLRAQMDALIEWAPLHYEVDISISIGVSYRLELLFTSVTLSVELGAALTIWGPPTGGEVHIDWSIISFTISFGADRVDHPPPLDWINTSGTGFAQTLLPPPSQANAGRKAALHAAVAPDASSAAPATFSITLTDGLLTTLDDGADTVWIVRPGGFTFAVLSTIPATEIDVAGPTGSAAVKYTAAQCSSDSGYGVWMRPMRTTLSASVLSIAVTDNDEGGTVVDFDADYDRDVALAGVPAAKWGKPLPAGTDPDPNQLLDGRLVGIQKIAPKPPVLTPGGADTLTIDTKLAFADEVIDTEKGYSAQHLPLAVDAQPPEAPPHADPDALQKIEQSLMGSAAAARGELFGALAEYGIDAGTNGDLTRLATNPALYLAGAPLLAQRA